jgi:hypothetical protein
MVAPANIGTPLYRGSRGNAMFRLPSGQKVRMCADDEIVVKEMKRRGLWERAEAQVAMGRSFALCDSRDGVDFFLWFGSPTDGGFCWHSFPGATVDTPEVEEFAAFLFNNLFAKDMPAAPQGRSHGAPGS